MSCVNRIYLLTACLGSIRVVQSALSFTTRDQINTAIQDSGGPVTISLTADITDFTEITIGGGKDVIIVSGGVNTPKILTAATSNRFFSVYGSLTLERITLNNV